METLLVSTFLKRYRTCCEDAAIAPVEDIKVFDAQGLGEGIWIDLTGEPRVNAKHIETIARACVDDEDDVIEAVVDLSQGKGGLEEAVEICAGIRRGAFVGLNLSQFFQDNREQCMAALCHKITPEHKLVYLGLNEIEFSRKSVGFATKLVGLGPALRTLHLSGCKLGSEGVKDLCKRITSTSGIELVDLDMSYNDCGVDGAKDIGIILEKLPIRRINVAGNAIGDKGFGCICAALVKRNMVEWLDTSDNGLTAISLIRSLSEALMEKKSVLEVVQAQNTITPVDDTFIEILAAALSVNRSLRVLNLASEVPGKCTTTCFEFLADSLGSNSVMIELGLPKMSSITSNSPEEVLIPIQRILNLNKKLGALLNERRSIDSQEKHTTGSYTEPKPRRPATSRHERPITPKVIGAISKWKEDASGYQSSEDDILSPLNSSRSGRKLDQSSEFSWNTEPSPPSLNMRKSLAERRQVGRNFEYTSSERTNKYRHGYTPRSAMSAPVQPPGTTMSTITQDKVRELKAALRAVRTRSTRHHAEIEGRLTGRLFELDSRINMIGEREKDQNVVKHRQTLPQHGETLVESRIEALESLLSNSAQKCASLASVSQSVSSQLEEMKKVLASQEPSMDPPLKVPDPRMDDLSDMLRSKLASTRNEVSQTNTKLTQDLNRKQDLWRDKLERQMEQLQSRLDLLEKSVINMHDDNIFALEAILQHRRKNMGQP